MPDRGEHDELDRELRELGPLIDYPPAPDVSRAVKLRLEDEAAHRPRRRRWLRTLARRPGWAAATAATVLLSLSILSPAIRATHSDVVSAGASSGASGASGGADESAGGADAGRAAEDAAGSSSAGYSAEEPLPPAGETVQATEPPDEASAGAAGASSSSASQGALGFGARIPPSEACEIVGGLLLPGAPEFASGPAATYAVGPDGEDGGVAVVFGPGSGLPPLGGTGAGLILVEVPGDPRSAYPAPDRVYAAAEEVDVGGVRGHWFPEGRSLRPQPGDAESLPGGALVWERDGVALLLRADITRREAVGIARTVR